ncbi:helix-turn-helix transcriptional regulator [Ureibacillus thermosphaericus]|uniref:helix-turn-helix transcriptional regulator n=1 Tax=Ureibacillus thermosphaericus TaxID=51173 RepID=UPI000BBBB389|nr:helix-turn-helix transcriptional regulator [Ureibacillus thermosphaericus]
MSEVLGVSRAWFNSIVNDKNEPSDELLLKIANYLEIDEHEIFKVAGRIHPDVLEKYKREYLGKYYRKN